MSLLELKNVNKAYGPKNNRTTVLRNINLSIGRGEFVAIVGYSGTGKTTLINLIAGLVKPDTGQATMDSNTITGPGPERGLVFQNYSLLPWLSVIDNVQLAIDATSPKLSVAARKLKAHQYLSMVNLAPAAQKFPHELSGGMRQRVSVARALAMDPQVLLLDEPLSALDALTRATIQDEIATIWARDKKTVLMITNDVDEAILLADRIIPLLPGKKGDASATTSGVTSGATLGASIFVDLPRPRDRKAINHNAMFKALRKKIFAQLTAARPDKVSDGTPVAHLPDVKPLDVSDGVPTMMVMQSQ
jgi:nitrate/nitrite transport system ATP-binding protein